MILISPNVSPSVFDFEKCRFRFENLNKYKNETIVINMASEHWGESSLVYQLYNDLSENGFDFWILSHHPGDHKKLERLVYYPWWYVYSRSNYSSKVDIQRPRQFSLGCLHGNPRPHRITNYFALRDRFPNEKICITIHNQDPLPWRDDDPQLTLEEQTRWKNIKDTFPDRFSITDQTDLNLPALFDAYLYLVPETTVIDRIFITEKTWKPIASGQLFLIFGNPGTIAHLRELGVDTYDDVIDHSYDSINDWRDRLNEIHTVIENLCRCDLRQIWHDTHERRRENHQKFFSGEFFMPQYQTPFDKVLETSHIPLMKLSSINLNE